MRGSLEKRRLGSHCDAAGVRWQVGWYLPHGQEHTPPTLVDLRRIDDGPGPATHGARVEIAPRDFTPQLLRDVAIMPQEPSRAFPVVVFG